MELYPCQFDTLEPRLLLALVNGVDPYNLGKGDWIWRIDAARSNVGATTNLALFQYLKNKGMHWVTVKAGDGASTWAQFTTQLVNDAHAAGLKIFAWTYMYGANPSGEANVAKAALAKGADGFIIDAEGEYERLANNAQAAQTFCESVRAAYPNHFLAHAPFPIVSYHSAFPYYTFGKYCDAVMPQDYWDAIGVSPSRMNQWRNDEWNTLYNNFRSTGKADAIKPIIPIAQGWNVSSTNTLTGQEILDFVSLMKNTSSPASPGGYKGVSFWSVQHHTAEHWSAIGQFTIGEPKFLAGRTIRVQGTGTSGLKAWSNSSSVAPATYVVKAEAAVGTIVSGPVFAEGYNRWEIRWKGETNTRWSAEDWLVNAAAPAAPAYTSPVNNANFVDVQPTSLAWQDVDVATSYDVYLDGALRANLTGNSWNLPALAYGTHTWQVRAKNSAGTAAGATWSFRFTTPLPGLVSFPNPVSGSTLAAKPAVLDWADATGATSYDVFVNGQLRANVTSSQWTIATPLAVKTPVNWQIIARNPGGGTTGPLWFFTLSPMAGDANADGTVDAVDFTTVYTNFGKPNRVWEEGDFDGDGDTDFGDYQALSLNFGRPAPASAAPAVTDEPAVERGVFSVTPVKRPPARKPIGARRFD